MAPGANSAGVTAHGRLAGVVLFVVVGLVAFVAGRLTAPSAGSPAGAPDSPAPESLARYEAALERVRRSPQRIPQEVDTLASRMREYGVRGVDDRLPEMRGLLEQVAAMTDEAWRSRRHQLAVQLRQRAGILRVLQDRASPGP